MPLRHEGTCVCCGKVYYGYGKQYCSQACNQLGNRRRVTKQCRQCGKTMSIAQSQVKYAAHDYCSLECQHLARTIERVCACCGKPFTHKASKTSTRYCSWACKVAGSTGTTVRQVSKPCEMCGASITDTLSHIDRRRFCSRGCHNASLAITLLHGVSKAEEEFACQLAAAGLHFSRHQHFGRYNADMCFEDAKLVVEFDGDYWHNRPGVPERDTQKDTYLLSRGYRVVRIRESAWRTDPAKAIETVKAALAD